MTVPMRDAGSRSVAGLGTDQGGRLPGAPGGAESLDVLSFDVVGVPAPQGSKAFKGLRNGRPILVESSTAVKPWRQDVVEAAARAMGAAGWVPLDGPVAVAVTFRLRRPVSAPKRRVLPDRKPDIDKLGRSTLDALTTAGAVVDDARVVTLILRKRYADVGAATGASIRVEQDVQR